MTQQNSKQETLAKEAAAPQPEEMLTIQVKNTALRLNGQNLKLAAKNGRNSKTPGLHLSAAHGREAAGQLAGQFTDGPPTREVTPPLDTQPATNGPASGRAGVRRPSKLAPLELPEAVREAQRQKLKFIQQELTPTTCKLSLTVSDPPRKVGPSRRAGRAVAAVAAAAARPAPSSEPPKPQQAKRPPGPASCDPPPLCRQLEEVVCRGTPAPVRHRPLPPRVREEVAVAAAGAACPGALVEAGNRRVRLRRTRRIEEDQCKSNTSAGGLSADEGKEAQGVRGEGQRADSGFLKGQMHLGRERVAAATAATAATAAAAAPWEQAALEKSHREDCIEQSAKCTLKPAVGEGAGGRHARNEVVAVAAASASNRRLKRKSPLITKHNNAVPLELLQ